MRKYYLMKRTSANRQRQRRLRARLTDEEQNQRRNDDHGHMGRHVSYTEVMEFQRHGLPHVHVLIRLQNNDIFPVDQFDSS